VKELRGGDWAPDPSHTRAAIRQASLVFMLTGTFALSTAFIPDALGYHNLATVIVSVLAILAGVLCRTSLTRRLTGYRSLLLGVFGLTLVAAANAVGAIPPIPLGVYFVVIFMWIGQWHPPGTSLRFAAFGALAYLLPFWLGAPHSLGAIPSVLLVIPVSVLAGEALAHQTNVARRAQREQAETLEALARASRTDDLTGLGNRRLGNQLLEGLRAEDAVVVLDLDNFKRVNDVYGHARGDQLLQELGAFLSAEVRELDTVARMGGEEFLLVIRQPDLGAATAVIMRLLTAWRLTLPLATLSAGVAIHVEGRGPSVTYAAADRALYEAKDAGRDRMNIAALSVGPLPL
jgi:diguanylate cyclase (GGDEF)-like protein